MGFIFFYGKAGKVCLKFEVFSVVMTAQLEFIVNCLMLMHFVDGRTKLS